jgi:hypothetical protein
MRFLLIIFTFYTLLAFAQKDVKNPCVSKVDTLTNVEVFLTVDKSPTVQGGMQALYTEVAKKIKYPDSEGDRTGAKVFVAFIVNTDGQIKGQRIVKNIDGTDLAEQLLDIIDDMKWIPGLCKGKPVATLLVMPMIIDVK